MQKISIQTNKREQFLEITDHIIQFVKENSIDSAVITVYCPHTTAAITINENADPDVTRDIIHEIDKIIPFEDGYRHFEGNSAAHIKASFFGSSDTLLVHNGRLQLGRWQGIYFCEFDGPRSREIWVQAGQTKTK